jgi:hypothetical protein
MRSSFEEVGWARALIARMFMEEERWLGGVHLLTRRRRRAGSMSQIALVLLVAHVFAAGSPLRAETLHYIINWASGLSLGEASIRSDESKDASKSGKTWTFDSMLDASVPGFALRDKYHSTADSSLCSTFLEKSVTRGTKSNEETVTFDKEKLRAERETKTKGGGKSDVSIPACAKDPMALLQFMRKELAQGRLASQQSVVFGSLYDVRFEYAGVQFVQVGGKRTESEKIQARIKGPASDVTVELFFARDAGRTPVLARIPNSAGTFQVELTR